MTAPALAPPPAAGTVQAQCAGCEVWLEPDEIGRVWPGGPLLCWLDGGDLEDWQPLVEPEPEPVVFGFDDATGHQATRGGYANRIAEEQARLADLRTVTALQAEQIKQQLREMMGL